MSALVKDRTISFKYKDNFPGANKGQFQIYMAFSTCMVSIVPKVSCNMETNTNPFAPGPWIQIWPSIATWAWNVTMTLVAAQATQIIMALAGMTLKYQHGHRCWSRTEVSIWPLVSTQATNINTEVVLHGLQQQPRHAYHYGSSWQWRPPRSAWRQWQHYPQTPKWSYVDEQTLDIPSALGGNRSHI